MQSLGPLQILKLQLPSGAQVTPWQAGQAAPHEFVSPWARLACRLHMHGAIPTQEVSVFTRHPEQEHPEIQDTLLFNKGLRTTFGGPNSVILMCLYLCSDSLTETNSVSKDTEGRNVLALLTRDRQQQL